MTDAARELPAALQPWRLWLDWFDLPLAQVLGELLLRLNPLLGPHPREAHGQLEPDGLEGLHRRGPYERLLLSEWAMADDLPDEFLRRAANHEHLFLAPKRISPQSSTRLLAVFDAGPTQWGAPRLLHLALWILLARRAQQAQVQFVWGLTHAPGELHSADSPEPLQQLLQARTPTLSSAAHWQAWQAQVGAEQLAERWRIGAPAPSAATAGFSHRAAIALHTDLQLHLSLSGPQATRSLQLALPDAAAAKRLLRGDFVREAAPRDSSAPTLVLLDKISLLRAPLISFSGKDVGVVLSGPRQSALIKVNPKNNDQPRIQYFHCGGQEIGAATISDFAFIGLTASATEMRFWNAPRSQALTRPGRHLMTLTPGLNRLRDCVTVHHSRHRSMLLLDDAGRLLSWTHEPLGLAFNQLDEHVLHLTQLNPQTAVYARHAGDKLQLITLMRNARHGELSLPMPKPKAVHLAGLRSRGQWTGAVAVTHAADDDTPVGHKRYSVYQVTVGQSLPGQYTHALFACEASLSLLGLVATPDDQGRDAYLPLMLHADRRSLLIVGAGDPQRVYQSPSPIRSVSVSFNGHRIALVTLDGELVVLGHSGRQVLLRVQGADDA